MRKQLTRQIQGTDLSHCKSIEIVYVGRDKSLNVYHLQHSGNGFLIIPRFYKNPEKLPVEKALNSKDYMEEIGEKISNAELTVYINETINSTQKTDILDDWHRQKMQLPLIFIETNTMKARKTTIPNFTRNFRKMI